MKAVGLQIEDLLLVGWNAAGVPLLGTTAFAPILSLGDDINPLAGIVQLAAVLGAIVAIATRPLGSALPNRTQVQTDARLAALGPLIGGIAFVAGSASAYLGFGIDGLVIGLAFIVIVAAMVLGDRLPVIDAGLRRALLLPFVLVTAGIFNAFAADILDGLDIAELLGALTVDETGFAIFVLGMIVAGLGVFYASLIVAPRLLVNPERDEGCLAWPLRFVIYLVSAVFGIGWLTLVGP